MFGDRKPGRGVAIFKLRAGEGVREGVYGEVLLGRGHGGPGGRVFLTDMLLSMSRWLLGPGPSKAPVSGQGAIPAAHLSWFVPPALCPELPSLGRTLMGEGVRGVGDLASLAPPIPPVTSLHPSLSWPSPLP